MKAEIRKDYFLDKHVIITPQRSSRPRSTTSKTIFLKKKACPFCPSKIEKDLIKKKYIFDNKNTKQWDIMVLKNKYPIVEISNPKAYGESEIIIETPIHKKELAQLELKQIKNLLEVYKDRISTLSKIPNIDYILVFKNKGGKAGASLVHAHSQVFASSLLPEDLKQEYIAILKYKQEHNSCPYCDIIIKEENSPRKIYSDKHVVAIAPYASRYHYESWIFPRRHIDNLNKLSKEEINSFSFVLKNILEKLYDIEVSYNFFLHQVISNKDQHFYLKIQPRESVWAGIELGSGIVVNSLSPEKAAKYLKIN
ncbi:DUF4931 domain-containing protein [Patescibacteria group bacterium]|nr:DUF4931 domain-containing protein [Patescibacteria group bacterium]